LREQLFRGFCGMIIAAELPGVVDDSAATKWSETSHFEEGTTKDGKTVLWQPASRIGLEYLLQLAAWSCTAGAVNAFHGVDRADGEKGERKREVFDQELFGLSAGEREEIVRDAQLASSSAKRRAARESEDDADGDVAMSTTPQRDAASNNDDDGGEKTKTPTTKKMDMDLPCGVFEIDKATTTRRALLVGDAALTVAIAITPNGPAELGRLKVQCDEDGGDCRLVAPDGSTHSWCTTSHERTAAASFLVKLRELGILDDDRLASLLFEFPVRAARMGLIERASRLVVASSPAHVYSLVRSGLGYFVAAQKRVLLSDPTLRVCRDAHPASSSSTPIYLARAEDDSEHSSDHGGGGAMDTSSEDVSNAGAGDHVAVSLDAILRGNLITAPDLPANLGFRYVSFLVLAPFVREDHSDDRPQLPAPPTTPWWPWWGWDWWWWYPAWGAHYPCENTGLKDIMDLTIVSGHIDTNCATRTISLALRRDSTFSVFVDPENGGRVAELRRCGRVFFVDLLDHAFDALDEHHIVVLLHLFRNCVDRLRVELGELPPMPNDQGDIALSVDANSLTDVGRLLFGEPELLEGATATPKGRGPTETTLRKQQALHSDGLTIVAYQKARRRRTSKRPSLPTVVTEMTTAERAVSTWLSSPVGDLAPIKQLYLKLPDVQPLLGEAPARSKYKAAFSRQLGALAEAAAFPSSFEEKVVAANDPSSSSDDDVDEFYV